MDRRRHPLLVRGEHRRRQAVRAGRPGGGHPRAGLRPRPARRRAGRRLRAAGRSRGAAVHGHRAGRGRRGVRRVRRALALPPGRLRVRAGRVHAAGQPAGGAVTGREGRGVPAGPRPVGALAVRRPRVGADHRRRARLPVRRRPGQHEQRHPAAQVRPAAPAARGGLVARLDEGADAPDRRARRPADPPGGGQARRRRRARCCTPSGTPTPGTSTCRGPSWSCWTSPRARWSARRPSRCSCRRCRRS